jgi:imidazolonepropionase-like amidohydrolase
MAGSSRVLAIRAGSLFDGQRALGPGMVLIQGGLITGIDASGAPPPADWLIHDFGDGVTVMPGLIDCHVHLSLDASGQAMANVAAVDDDALLQRMVVAATTALQAGITTVRDLGDRRFLTLRLRDHLRRNGIPAPRIVAAGPPLTTHGGHLAVMGGEAEGPDELKASVEERARRGCEVVKVMASGGVTTPGSRPHDDQYGAEDLRTVVDQSHERGLRTAAHVHAVTSIVNALEAGFDSLEHVTFMTADGVASDHRLIERIAGSGSFVSLTIGAVPDVGRPPPAVGQRLEQIRSNAARLCNAGANIVLGTDAGLSPGKPHDVLPYALEALVDLGIPPKSALHAVTTAAADACGLRGLTGRLAQGACADLTAINGDPLGEISDVRNVVAVYRDGHLVVDRCQQAGVQTSLPEQSRHVNQ